MVKSFLYFGGKRNPDGQGFAAFGKVVKGMNVIKKIQQLPEQGQILVRTITIRSICQINKKQKNKLVH